MASASLSRLGIRAGGRDEEQIAVVAQLVNGFDDIGERTVAAVLRRTVAVDVRIPAAGELLDGAHVDDPIVQVLHEARHVAVEEFLVGANGIAGKQGLDPVRGEPCDILGHLAFGLLEAQAMLPFVDQAGTGVHRTHEIIHMGDSRVGRLDNIVHALVEHVEIEIGGDDGHLAQLVVEDIQSGHLAINPDHARILRGIGLCVMCVYHGASFLMYQRSCPTSAACEPPRTGPLRLPRGWEKHRVSDLRTFLSGLDFGCDQIVIDLAVGGIVEIVVEFVQHRIFGRRCEQRDDDEE